MLQRVTKVAGARPSIVFYTPLPTIGASRSGERVPSILSPVGLERQLSENKVHMDLFASCCRNFHQILNPET
jgi:hypothetical protein